MELTTDKCIFQITDKVRQTRVGTHIPPLSFVAYPKDKKLCIIFHLQEYLKRTTHFRKDSKQLLLSHVKPHGPVSEDTISRWCKSVLSSAGIDTSKFKGHSTRPHRPPILQIITWILRTLCCLQDGQMSGLFSNFTTSPLTLSLNLTKRF